MFRTNSLILSSSIKLNRPIFSSSSSPSSLLLSSSAPTNNYITFQNQPSVRCISTLLATLTSSSSSNTVICNNFADRFGLNSQQIRNFAKHRVKPIIKPIPSSKATQTPTPTPASTQTPIVVTSNSTNKANNPISTPINDQAAVATSTTAPASLSATSSTSVFDEYMASQKHTQVLPTSELSGFQLVYSCHRPWRFRLMLFIGGIQLAWWTIYFSTLYQFPAADMSVGWGVVGTIMYTLFVGFSYMYSRRLIGEMRVALSTQQVQLKFHDFWGRLSHTEIVSMSEFYAASGQKKGSQAQVFKIKDRKGYFLLDKTGVTVQDWLLWRVLKL